MATRDTKSDAPPEGNGQPVGSSDWRSILVEAPDYAQIVKTVQTAKAREYSLKVKSMIKSGVVGAINVNDFPDAAALLAYGPGFADAAGQLADADKRAERALEILTSPNSPWLTFALTSMALASQIFRNHEDAIKEIPNARRNARLRRKAMANAKKAEPPRFTIRFFGREWPVRFRSRFKLSKLTATFTSQSQDPETLTLNVFSDPKVIQQLSKMGVRIIQSDTPPKA